VNLGWPVFIEAKDDGGGGDNWTTGATSRAKLQSNHHHQQTNIHFSAGRMHFLTVWTQNQGSPRPLYLPNLETAPSILFSLRAETSKPFTVSRYEVSECPRHRFNQLTGV